MAVLLGVTAAGVAQESRVDLAAGRDGLSAPMFLMPRAQTGGGPGAGLGVVSTGGVVGSGAGSGGGSKWTRVESELAETTMVSYGDYRVFGATARCNVYTSGLEYDRHSWGYFLKARIDYVVEVLPWVILREPASADFWGNPTSPDTQTLHGLGITPFGFRFMWRNGTRVKPFMTGKAGGIFFNKKAMSPNSTYANFNFQGDFGLQVPLSRRVELRVVPFEYFHVSNGYLAASNPGMDELAAKFGLSWRLGHVGDE